MPPPFFPSPAFAWTFYLALVGFTAAAAWTDLRQARIPRRLTLSMLALGVLVSAARVAWLGAGGRVSRVLLVPVNGSGTGALAGLQLATLGALLAFALLLVMWLLRTCQGGDVKLFTALGAWAGPELTLWLLLGTVALVALFHLTRRVAGRPGQGTLPYAPAVALSVAVVLGWTFRGELLPGLVERGSSAAHIGR